MIYKVYLHYTVDQEIKIEAQSEDEAINKAWQRFDPVCGKEYKDEDTELISEEGDKTE